ncbi:MAG: DUF1512 domain-containing protein [Candidatus Bathyarchaeota archaeon]|nr:DUF1512 domain-containing protein [Candidatus Bathyarchaeota archaeon]
MLMAAAVQAPVSMGIFPQDNGLGWILQLIWIVFFVVFMFYGQRIQMTIMLREIASSLYKLRLMRDKGRSIAISTIKELGNPNDDPTPRVDRFLEHIYIPPVSLDPVGIIQRLEHIIDVRDLRFKGDVKAMAPQADETQIDNLTMVLEVALDLNQIYKIIRHFYLQGKKTLSIYTVMQLQMILPIVMKQSEALANALRALTLGQPIGDGAGCLVAGRLMYGSEKREIAKDIVVSDVMIEGRKAYVLKAKGPGGNVGKPGEAIKRILEENEGKVSFIILIDAALKLEGEKVGEVAEGIGVAIGPAGLVDKYKVEEIATKYKVPLNAIVIKEDIGDAYSTMRKEIIDGAEIAVERIKQLIQERTKEGDTVIVAGIGNTMGVGQ